MRRVTHSWIITIGGGDPAFKGDVTEIRKIYDTQWAGLVLERCEANFPVKTERRQIAGVSVDIGTPARRRGTGQTEQGAY